MFTAESIRLLAKPARRQTRTQHDVGTSDELRPHPADDSEVDASLPLSPGDDLDANIDPDDRVMRQTNDLACALPEMPAEWWTRMALDPDQTPVTPTDVQTVFEFVSRRLAGTNASQAAFAPPPDATVACLLPSEGGDSEPTQSSATAGVEFDSIATVGEMHESLTRHFGPAGWTALVSLWQEAAGIQQPKRQPKPSLAPILAGDSSPKDDELPPLPSSTYPMEEGLHRALPEMPIRVVAFLLHVPPDPAAWRYQESEAERETRQALEAIGGWVGG
jgi:hypothetical protein